MDKYGRRIQWANIDPQIAGAVQAAVLEAGAGDQTAARALELGMIGLVWAEHLVSSFEAANALPRPIACQPDCTPCCFNQVELTPPEAILIGHHVAVNFAADDKTRLLTRLERSLARRAGKSKVQAAQIRRELPCPFLLNNRCAVYPVRPLVCRAMHALDAEKCRRELTSRKPVQVEYYSHRYDLIMSVTTGIRGGCQALGLQAEVLDLSRALGDFLRQESPIERWFQGEKVFSPLLSR